MPHWGLSSSIGLARSSAPGVAAVRERLAGAPRPGRGTRGPGSTTETEIGCVAATRPFTGFVVAATEARAGVAVAERFRCPDRLGSGALRIPMVLVIRLAPHYNQRAATEQRRAGTVLWRFLCGILSP